MGFTPVKSPIVSDPVRIIKKKKMSEVNARCSSLRNQTPTSKQLSLLKKMFSDNDPTDFQLGLLQKILEPGADRSKVILCYYVAEVKYYKPYGIMCCFCVPYSGDFDDINIFIDYTLKYTPVQRVNTQLRWSKKLFLIVLMLKIT